MSNNRSVGGNEVNALGGWKFALGDSLKADLGAIYYLFSKDKADSIADIDYYEVYAGIESAQCRQRAYYSPEFAGNLSKVGGSSQDAWYVFGDYTHPLSDTYSLTAQGGYSSGDAIKVLYGEESYADYSLTLNVDMGAGYVATIGAVDTDLSRDDVKLLAGLKKSFAF